MKVIGIVGGIGAGKSTVVRLVSEHIKSYVINADHIGHEILKKGNDAYVPVIESFGEQILGEDGQINRKMLGTIVFSDSNKLQILNQITHPLIYRKVQNEITAIKQTGLYEYIIVDAALLIEIQLIDLVDEVWGVYAEPEVRMERIICRDGLSKEEAIQRMKSQRSWEQLQKVIDVEINNSKEVSDTKEQIISLIGHK